MVCGAGFKICHGEDLGTEGEKVLGDIMMEKGYEMYWIHEYPEEAKPFYIMEKEGTPYSYSFDLDYRGQEMASGGQREHRHDRLTARMQKKGSEPVRIRLLPERVRLRHAAAWRVGLRRGTVCGQDAQPTNIREAILFPRDRNRLVP